MVSDDVETLQEWAEDLEQNDISIAMERLYTAIEAAYPDEERVDEAVEETTLPFLDDERGMAFLLGMAFGEVTEQEFPEDEAE